MLLPYFGFKEEPFGITPDPGCIYPSQTHRESLASIRCAFQSNRGFSALIAPPGMGKTTLVRRFLGVDFGATIDVAYYLYTNGQAYAPTVIKSDAKDGSFDTCDQEMILSTKFPKENVDKPFGATGHFKIGQYGDTQLNH